MRSPVFLESKNVTSLLITWSKSVCLKSCPIFSVVTWKTNLWIPAKRAPEPLMIIQRIVRLVTWSNSYFTMASMTKPMNRGEANSPTIPARLVRIPKNIRHLNFLTYPQRMAEDFSLTLLWNSGSFLFFS